MNFLSRRSQVSTWLLGAFTVLLLGADVASAITVKLAWDASAGATGYRVYAGTSSGTYSAPVDVGNVTTYTYNSLPNGTNYFAVKAYNTGGDSVSYSNEAIETAPTVPGTPNVTALSATSLRATWTASTDNVTATGFPEYRLDVSSNSGFTSILASYNNLDINNVVTFDITGLTAATTYWVRLRSVDTGGNTSANSGVGSAATQAAPDTTLPTISISSPTTSTTFSTTAATVNLSGSTSDNVAVTSVTWVNDQGGSGSATLTGSPVSGWSISNIALVYPGANAITVTASDAAGNTRTDTLTVTRTDTTAPTAPTGLGLSVLGTTSIRASWTASTDTGGTGVTAYELDVATNSGFTTYVTGYQDRDVGNVTTFDVTGLNPGVTYYVRVRARDLAGNTSTSSASANAATTAVAPAAPTNLRIIP